MWNPDRQCDVIRCPRKWAVFVPDRFRPAIREAVFGYGPPNSYEDWAAQPHGFFLCRFHEPKLRSQDGIQLGYHFRDGKVRAFVKHQDF